MENRENNTTESEYQKEIHEKAAYRLIRHVGFPESQKEIHRGPLPGGLFWALEQANDLPDQSIDQTDPSYPFVEVNLGEVLASGARVWVASVESSSPIWREIKSLDDIPLFEVNSRENYDQSISPLAVSPFIPEFYVVGGPKDPERTLRCTNCGHIYKKGTHKKKYGDAWSSPCDHCGKGVIRWMIYPKNQT